MIFLFWLAYFCTIIYFDHTTTIKFLTNSKYTFENIKIIFKNRHFKNVFLVLKRME